MRRLCFCVCYMVVGVLVFIVDVFAFVGVCVCRCQNNALSVCFLLLLCTRMGGASVLRCEC